jgi:hypothetical protein
MSAARAEEACVLEPAKLRFDDDYGCFRDPENRADLLGDIKLVPLDLDEWAFLSLGGEVRQRYEYTRDPLFGADPQDRAGVWLQRFSLHGDLSLGSHVRVFAQLSSSLELGREAGPSPVDENELALQNAFLDLNLPLGNRPAWRCHVRSTTYGISIGVGGGRTGAPDCHRGKGDQS